ncbi:hypothetical protein [Prevotella sp.]|nr:hypothetical protein [Prevotella sp.]
MRNLICILTLSICSYFTGCSTQATGSNGNDSVAVALSDSLHSDSGDSIMMELSANRFKAPVDTIVSAKIVNNTKCSSISLKGKRVVEKKIGENWIPFEHRERSKGGAMYSATLLAVNIGNRLGREIEINGKEKRYVYSVFTVY